MAFAHPRQKMDCDSNRRDGDGQRCGIDLEIASIVENCFLDAKPLGTPGGFFIARLKNNSVENQCVVKKLKNTCLFLLTIRKVDVSLGYQLTKALKMTHNEIWKIGKQEAEIRAAIAALEKVASFTLDRTLTTKEADALRAARDILERASDRLAEKMSNFGGQQ